MNHYLYIRLPNGDDTLFTAVVHADDAVVAVRKARAAYPDGAFNDGMTITWKDCVIDLDKMMRRHGLP